MIKNIEKKFFEWQVNEKMKFYGISYKQAVTIVKRMKDNSILWNSAMNAWFDTVHPY